MPIQNFSAFLRENLDAPTDQHGKRSSTFELSFVKVMDELADLRDYATVEVTLDKEDPNKVLLKFRGKEDS